MGAFIKLIDAILFLFFLVIALAVPLLDAQTCLPSHIYPDILVQFKKWYANEYEDYLVTQKPHFFVGLVWLEIFFSWPLSIASLYGIISGKSWLRTTCLMHGVSTFTAMKIQSKEIMETLMKVMDGILFPYFILITLAVPLVDAQTCLPSHIFLDILVQFKNWYVDEYGHYLVIEKPHFFIGLVWLEIIFSWPLSLASLYAIVAGKSWLPTVCLMYGVAAFTSLVAILSELMWSGKAPEKLLMLYTPFAGFAILAILRGLLPHSGKSNSISKRPALIRKKRV